MDAIPKSIPSSVARPSTNPYTPPKARVRDVVRPKTVTVQAGLGSRLGASIVDGLIFSVMFTLPLIVGMILAAFLMPRSEESAAAALVLSLGFGLVGLIAWTWLTLRQMSETGQSLAKKYFNIKVVRSDGSPASLGNLVWKRNVVNWLLGIIPIYPLIDILFIFREDRQCLHDKIADTIVIEA